MPEEKQTFVGTLILVSKKASAGDLDTLVMSDRRRPVAIMEDFSLMALRVDRLTDSAGALAEDDFPVSENSCGIRVSFDGVPGLGKIFDTLARRRIKWEWADIAEAIYQG